jgi:hypothetical protein
VYLLGIGDVWFVSRMGILLHIAVCSCKITGSMVSKYSKWYPEVVNFQKYWEQQFYLAHHVLPQTGALLTYQREEYHQALPLNQYLHIILHHHVVHMLSQLMYVCTLKVHTSCGCTESMSVETKKEHKMEKNPPLNTTCV